MGPKENRSWATLASCKMPNNKLNNGSRVLNHSKGEKFGKYGTSFCGVMEFCGEQIGVDSHTKNVFSRGGDVKRAVVFASFTNHLEQNNCTLAHLTHIHWSLFQPLLSRVLKMPKSFITLAVRKNNIQTNKIYKIFLLTDVFGSK